MYTLTQIKYAIAVDQHRNFSRAARASNVSQPTLSMQLQKLESQLDMVIFDRSRKPVVPTREGEVLLKQFRKVLAEQEQIDEVIATMRGVLEGPFRLGIIPTMAPSLLPRIVPGFVEAHPLVILHIEELTTADIIRRLCEDSLDAGILATPLNEPRLSEFPLFREEFQVFHSPLMDVHTDETGRVALEDLPSDRLMVMRAGHCLRTQTLDLCALGDTASLGHGFRLEAGSLASLCAMVGTGPFFTVLPALNAAELNRQGLKPQVKEIAGDIPYREVSLVTRRLENRRAVRAALIEHAQTVLSPLEASQHRQRKEPVAPT